MAANGGVVLPSNIAAKTSATYFEKKKKNSELPPEELWNAAERTVTELVVDGATEKQVLMNPMLSIPAWFRVFYPEELDSDIVATYGERAKSEITSDLEDFLASRNKPALDTFMGLWQAKQPQSTPSMPC